MNRTVSVNIGGFNFIMDEKAYEKLSAYLNRYRQSLNIDERDEVMNDIEYRIAEIFGGVHCQGVISEMKVDEVISTIGEPEITTEASSSEFKSSETTADKIVVDKKLYRDTDDCVIGGICSGLASYFNLSTILVRLLFLLGFFMWGTTLLVYVIMWLVVPQAHGVREKLAMKGGFDAQTGARADGKKVGAETEKSDRGGCMGCFLRGIVIIFAVLAGLPILIALLGLVVGLIGAMVGILGAMVSGSAALSAGSIFMLGGFGVSGFFLLSVLGLLFLPLLFVVLLLAKVLFRRKWKMMPVFVVMLLLWLASMVCVISNVVDVAPKFLHQASAQKTVDTFALTSDRLVIMPLEEQYEWDKSVSESSEHRLDDTKFVFKYDERGKEIDIELLPKLFVSNYEEGEEDGRVKLDIRVSSCGETEDLARQSLDAIGFNYKIVNDTLYLGRRMKLAEGAEWRAQKLTFKLFVPKGVKVESKYPDQFQVPMFYYSYDVNDESNLTLSSSVIDRLYDVNRHKYIRLVEDDVPTSSADSVLTLNYNEVFNISSNEGKRFVDVIVRTGLYKVKDITFVEGVNNYSLERVSQ